MKKNQGITLIALIVTIIILIILAGITIALIAGGDGILGKASKALDENEEATATEKMELKITYFNMISYGENARKANLQELAEGMFQDKEIEYVKIKETKVASLEAIDVTGENSIFVKLKEYPYEFEIDSSLQLASVDGVKVANSNSDQIKKLENEIATLNEENKKLKAELEILKNSDISKEGKDLKILKNEMLTMGYSTEYTFEKNYRSAIAIIGAADNQNGGTAIITPQLTEGTYETYYNNNRISNSTYSINGAMVFMENIQENDIVTLQADFCTIYAIIAVE